MPIIIGYDRPLFDHAGYRQLTADNHGEVITTERLERGIDAAMDMAERPDAEGLSLLERLEASPMFVKSES